MWVDNTVFKTLKIVSALHKSNKKNQTFYQTNPKKPIVVQICEIRKK